jgi:ketosteroid isomerase-like protein
MSGNDEQEICEIEKRIAAAIVGRDAAFVEHIFDPNFVYTGIRGEVKTRADILAEMRSGSLGFDSMAFEDVHVRQYGETAIVTGLAVVHGRSPQGPIAGEFRYTRVYVRQADAWQLAAFQGTPLVRST